MFLKNNTQEKCSTLVSREQNMLEKLLSTNALNVDGSNMSILGK
jgi:hypothetical protein